MGDDKLRESLAGLYRQMVSVRDIQNELDVAVLSNVTQVRIVQELLKGRRTVARLVEEFYGLRKGDPEFSTHYSRVRKELEDLESRAMVSRRMFGRDKPYSLTQIGMERLTRLRGSPSPRILALPDALTYAAALILGAICAAVIMTGVNAGTPITLLAFVFVFVGGSAFSRLSRALGRVRPLSMPGETERDPKAGRGGETMEIGKPEKELVTGASRWGRMSMTTKIIGFGVLFGAIFLALGSVTLLGVAEGEGPSYLGIPSEKDVEIPSRGERFLFSSMTIDELRDEFRLTEEETSQLAVLVEERDNLQSQVDQTLDGIRELVGPGVHKLDAEKLKREYDLTDDETSRLEVLIEEWIRLAEASRNKYKDIMDYLASIGVIRAR
jgi:hypothetical protein